MAPPDLRVAQGWDASATGVVAFDESALMKPLDFDEVRHLCLKPCLEMYMEFLEKNRTRLHQFGIKGRKVLAWGCGTDASATQLSTSPAIAMHPTEPLTWKQEPRTKGHLQKLLALISTVNS